MTVILSPVGGVAGQFFDNNGSILTGGKIYTYAAGTTTPQATYTTVSGGTAHTNPIILDAAGRVPGGEVWVTNGVTYKFLLKTSTDVLLGTYDNVTGINDSTLLLAYEAAIAASSGSSLVGYLPAGTGAVATTVQAKLRERVSVLDFGADPTGTNPCQAAITAAIASLGTTGGIVFFPVGTYKITAAVTLIKSAITLQGCGSGLGDAGASLLGATVINVVGVNFINVNSTVVNFTMENMYVVSAVASGAALAIDSVGSINNLLMRSVYVQGMANALYVGATATIISAQIELCQFGYNTNEHIKFLSGASINNVGFITTRFEPAGDGFSLIKAVNIVGEMKFFNCVFESCLAKYAVDCGANAAAWSFIGCHFENNAGKVATVPTNGGCDVYIGNGASNVSFSGCSFSYPQITTTNFYNIITAGTGKITASNNTILGQNRSGYLGFISNLYTTDVTLIGNRYDEASGTPLDYTSGITNPVRFNDFQQSLKWGAVNGPIVKGVTTTNATPTIVWGGQYLIPASSAMFAEANVVGTDVTGANYCAFTTRVLVTTDATGAGTIQGTTTETPIVSAGQAAAFALVGSLSSTGLVLNVTGVAATTIKWVANVTLNKIGF